MTIPENLERRAFLTLLVLLFSGYMPGKSLIAKESGSIHKGRSAVFWLLLGVDFGPTFAKTSPKDILTSGIDWSKTGAKIEITQPGFAPLGIPDDIETTITFTFKGGRLADLCIQTDVFFREEWYESVRAAIIKVVGKPSVTHKDPDQDGMRTDYLDWKDIGGHASASCGFHLWDLEGGKIMEACLIFGVRAKTKKAGETRPTPPSGSKDKSRTFWRVLGAEHGPTFAKTSPKDILASRIDWSKSKVRIEFMHPCIAALGVPGDVPTNSIFHFKNGGLVKFNIQTMPFPLGRRYELVRATIIKTLGTPSSTDKGSVQDDVRVDLLRWEDIGGHVSARCCLIPMKLMDGDRMAVGLTFWVKNERKDTADTWPRGVENYLNYAKTRPSENNETLTAVPSMYHEVTVPKKFCSGRGWHAAPSDIERYVKAYEDGWWRCIKLHVKDIDYQSTDADKTGIGWPARVEGLRQGFEDAQARISSNIERFGKKRTHEYLIQIWEGI